MRIIAISDIHGCYAALQNLLERVKYNKHKDRLIIVGDLVDRGPQSKEVVQYVRELSLSYDVQVIGGNHDDMFTLWLDSPNQIPEYEEQNIGGSKTIWSFCDNKIYKDIDHLRLHLQEQFEPEISFLKSLPEYIEDEYFNFVHAGINPHIKDWRTSDSYYFKRDRKVFLNSIHEHNKIFVFGHTPTKYLNNDKENHNIWVGQNRIGIDGGCVFGGQLNALIIEENTFTFESVKK